MPFPLRPAIVLIPLNKALCTNVVSISGLDSERVSFTKAHRNIDPAVLSQGRRPAEVLAWLICINARSGYSQIKEQQRST